MDTLPQSLRDSSEASEIARPATPAPSTRRSPGWARLIGPLGRAQAAFPVIEKTREATESTKNRDTGQYEVRKFRFADLTDVLKAVRPALLAHGFVPSTGPVESQRGWLFRAELLHESGEWLACELPIPDPRKIHSPHEEQAHYTLYARYALCQLLGIAAEEVTEVGRLMSGAPPVATAAPAIKQAPPAKPRARTAASTNPPPAETPALAPPPAEAEEASQTPDYTNSAVRSAALRTLRGELQRLGVEKDLQAAEGAWLAAAAALAALGEVEMEMTVDAFRRHFGAEPPPIDGVSYPAQA